MDFHVINKNNKYIVIHSKSLRLFSVSENLGKILESYESEQKDHDSMVHKQRDYGETLSELLRYIEDIASINMGEDLTWKNKEPKTLCLLISQDCNLRCRYCYADHGTFGGEEKMMNIDTAKKCIDKILKDNFSNFVVFFGGEPFLNISLMKEVEEYGRQAGLEIKYTTVTNGTIMNNAIGKFILEKLFSICISLDGPKEINDMQRCGSVRSVHDHAMMAINKLKLGKMPLYIKCTVTKNSINRLDNIAKYLSTFGVNQIAFAPVSMIPQESELFISDSEFELYAKELSAILVENINQLASGNKVTELSPIFAILRQLVTKTRIIHHCSVGREYIAVTADGDVYPCHEFVGMAEFNMGNINDEDFPGKPYNKIKSIFSNHSVYTCNECSTCWARFLCGGDCAIQSYVCNDDLFRPTKRKCILIKSILEALLPEIVDIFQDKNKMENIIKFFNEFKQGNISQNQLLD